MNSLRWFFVLALASLAAFAPEAVAGTTCTANMDGGTLALGDSTGVVNARIEVVCDTDTFPSFSDIATVKLCIGIGPGEFGSEAQRRMKNVASDDSLDFIISRTPSALSNDWGSSQPNQVALEFSYPLDRSGILGLGAKGSGGGSILVHGRVPSRAGLAAGDYSSQFVGNPVSYRYRDRLGGTDPATCLTGGDSGVGAFNFVATATVRPSCSVVTASDMSFNPGGMPLSGTRTGNLASTSTIDLTCTKRTSWQVGLDDGLHATAGGTRQMCNPDGACIAYRLNRTSGTNPWGDDIDVNTVEGTSAGTSQSLTVHGRVDDQPLLQAGRYSDTVKVVLTY